MSLISKLYRNCILFILTFMVACVPEKSADTPVMIPADTSVPIMVATSTLLSDVNEPEPTVSPTIMVTPTATSIPYSELDEIFGLPVGYHVETLMSPAIGDVFSVAVSETGYIYAEIVGDTYKKGIYVYNPNTGKVKKLWDKNSSTIFDGPGDTVFVKDDEQNAILQLFPDGRLEEWTKLKSNLNIRPIYYTRDGRMFGTIGGRKVIEIFQSGSYQMINDTFDDIVYVVQMPDGAIIVTEFLVDDGRVSRIEPDGTKTVIFRGLGDSANYLKVSPSGELFVNGNKTGLARMDPKTGRILKQYPFGFRGGICAGGTGFSFIDEIHVALANNSMGTIIIGNLQDGTAANILDATPTNVRITVGNDGLYLASAACKNNQMVPTIYKMLSSGEIESVLELPPQKEAFSIDDIAVDSDGNIFFLMHPYLNTWYVNYLPSGENTIKPIRVQLHGGPASLAIHPISGNLFMASGSGVPIYERLPDGTLKSYSVQYPETLTGVNIDFSPDGELYVSGSGRAGHDNGPVTQIYFMKVDLILGISETTFSWEHEGSSGGTSMAFGKDGYAYFHTNGDIYGVIRISQDGVMEKFVNRRGYGIDASGLAIDSENNLYITSPNGIFKITHENTDK